MGHSGIRDCTLSIGQNVTISNGAEREVLVKPVLVAPAGARSVLGPSWDEASVSHTSWSIC